MLRISVPYPFCDSCKTLVDLHSGRCPKCHTQQAVQKHVPPDKPKSKKKAIWQDPSQGSFPYPYRPYQEQFVAIVKEALSNNHHIVVESGTGTGKTVCSLVAALDLAKDSKRKVVYLNRTNSQSDQVMQELRVISQRSKVVGLPLTGRGKSCLFMREAEIAGEVPPNALSRFCEEKKKRTKGGKEGGCGYYANLVASRDGTFENYVAQELPTAQEFDDFCADEGVCPYECRKLLAVKADVIIAPYVHVLSEDLREQFLDRIGVGLDSILLIVDEAHNLIDSARESESFSLSMNELDAGAKELREHGEEEIGHDVTLVQLVNAITDIIASAVRDQLGDANDAELGKRFLEGELARRLELNVEGVRTVAVNTFNLGQTIAEKKLEEGVDATSVTLLLGKFLTSWFSVNDRAYVKAVSNYGGGGLQAINLEPEELETFLAACPAALHMSGTLQPLQQYVEVAGLPNGPIQRTFPSPFPPENRLVLYTPHLNPAYEVMKRDGSMQSRLQDQIIELCNSVNVSTMVFFRSYELLHSFRLPLEEGISRRKYWDIELSGNHFNRAVIDFKARSGGVFFTVMGGRVSEGMDFPGKQLEMALIVGLPYPPPTLANRKLQELYDRKYGRGKGWEYAQEAPALRKVQQAMGRLIRTETDRGAAIILDSRVSKYAEQLGARSSTDPVSEVKRFYAKR